jgi:hypothetical protein
VVWTVTLQVMLRRFQDGPGRNWRAEGKAAAVEVARRFRDAILL